MLFFLSKGYRVIAVDRRGHGRSTQTHGGKVVRYLARHDDKNVVKAALISAVPPLMVKTPANPLGSPKSTPQERHAKDVQRLPARHDHDAS